MTKISPSPTIGVLLDQGLPRAAAPLLRAVGIDSLHLADVGMSSADDADVLAEARRRGWFVATLDSDFATLLAASGASEPSVIHLRVQGLTAGPLADLLVKVVALKGPELSAGAVVTVLPPARVRHRLLPLRRP